MISQKEIEEEQAAFTKRFGGDIRPDIAARQIKSRRIMTAELNRRKS